MTLENAKNVIAKMTLVPDADLYKYHITLHEEEYNHRYSCIPKHTTVGDNWYKYLVPVIPEEKLTLYKSNQNIWEIVIND